MTLRLFLFSVVLLVAGCGPGEGDIYENLLTGERVEIAAVGGCQELADQAARIIALGEDEDLGLTMDPETLWGTPLVLDSTGSCYASHTDMDVDGVAHRFYIVRSVDYLEDDRWRKLN